MASVNKLSIRGIRAFSPEDREQVVEFFMPLTIIVGANGCGKTTIIEALKYAITGALPPGNKSGQAFVHDPKTIDSSQVKASVKLRFTTKAGQTMVVVRSMELTLKKTTASFRQLDGVVRSMDPNTGEKRSLSHKCTELDKQVPLLMGVSRAILEHVLFCHQEEASWPLMEGAVLKKRFDAIFDSTRYSKAIEVLRKKEKEYNNKVKEIKIELAGYTSHRHAAKGFRKELDEAHEVMEEIDEEKIKIKRELKEAEETITKYAAILQKADLVDAKIKSIEDAMYRHTSVVEKQRDMLENDMTDSDVSDLKAQLQDFDQTMSAQVEEQQELQRQHSRLLGDIERLRKEEMKLSNDLTAHNMAVQEQQRRQAKRFRIMEEICNTHSLDLQHFSQSQADQSFAASLTAGTTSLGGLSQESSVTVSAEDMASFFEALGNKEQELQSKMDANKKRIKAADDEMQKAIQELSGKKQIIKNDLARLEKKKNDLQAEQSELLRKVSAHSRIRKGDVEETRKKAAEFAKKRDEANNDPRKTEIPTEIRQLEEKIDKLKRQIDEDRLTLKTLRLSADAQSSITLLEDQSKRDLEQLKEDVGENISTFQKFNIPNVEISLDDDETGAKLVDDTEALVDAIRSKYEASHADLAKANEELAKTQKIISEKNALMSNLQRTIQTLKPKLEQVSSSVDKVKKLAQDLRRHESNLGLTCRLTEESPRDLVSYLDKRLEELMEDAPVENSAKAVKKFIKKMKQMAAASSECPCCKNTIDTQEAYQAFIDNLGALGNEVQKENPQYEEAKSNYDGWRKVMSECIDDLRDHQRLSQEMREAELQHQSMVDDIGHFQGKLRNQKNDMEDLQRSDDELREFLDVAKRWSDDAGRIAQKRGEIGQKNIDLSASLIDTDRDLRSVERDLNRMMEDKDDMANKIASLNREMTQLNSAVTSFATQASRMEKVAREKEERFASERKNAERKAEIVELLQSISHEEKGLNDQLSPITKKISMKSSERDRARALGEDEDRAMSGELSKFRTDVRALRSIAKEIDDFEEQQEGDSNDVEAKVASVQKKISKRKQDVEDLRPHLEEMKKAVDDQERHKKQLIQNIEILESQKRKDELEKQKEALREERDQIEEVDDADGLHEAAQEKRGVLKEQKYRTEGRFSEVAEQIRSLKRKLSHPEYKNVEEQCRVAQIKLDTTQLAAGDLKKYAAAIDKALLQYHRVKIAEINKTIRELWLLTYKGEDITNIELVSGQDTSSRSNKSYNYRVVMTKGAGNKLDMRGRCSAGQRVLACIVIRLALAEAFGVSFGCLCLDEPTTNLDYRNKKGLALALCQIVAQRQQQRNFQLVCISHDLEFVSMMKTELSATAGISMPENFFQLRREEAVNGMYYSKIDAVEWDELGA